MKQVTLAALVAAAALAAAGLLVSRAHGVPAEEAHSAVPSTRLAPNVLRYPVGSSQLAFLAIAPLQASVPPVTDPLPARLVFDENRTVRVYSPVAGSVAQIP